MAGRKVRTAETKPTVEQAARPAIKATQIENPGFKSALAWDNRKDTTVMPRTIAIEALYDRAKIPMMNGKARTRVSGSLVTGSGSLTESHGRAIRRPAMQRFTGWDSLNKFRESNAGKAKRLRESHGIDLTDLNVFKRWNEARKNKSLMESDGFAQGYDLPGQFASANGPNNEYIPLMLGPFNRNLYLTDFQDQAAKGFWEVNHDPVAKALALLMLHFPLGSGITVNFSNPMCQTVWDAFVQTTDWHNQMRKLAMELTVIGEAWIYDPIMGPPSMTLWDATTVWEVVTNPRDISQVYYAHRQWPTQWQLMLGTEYLKGGTPPPSQEYVIEQVGPQDWLQVKANATVGEKRGRSDFYPALAWLKSFRDWFNAAVVKGMISNSFVVWWQINGSDGDISAFQNSSDMNTVPPPGSAWFTNQQVKPEFLQTAPAVGSDDETGKQILSIIAASMNVPSEYLGVEGKSNRATSITKSEPGWKTFEFRQQLLREVVEWQIGRVLWKARRDGLLPENQPRDAAVRKVMQHMRTANWDRARVELDSLSRQEQLQDKLDTEFEIIFPKLQPEERSLFVKDVAAGEAQGYISHQTAAEQFYKAMEMPRMDYETEQEKRRAEQEAGVVPSMQLTDMGGQGVEGFEQAEDGSQQPGDSADVAKYKDDNQERPRR